MRRRLETEKLELEAALSEAESAVEQEENKVMRAQIDLVQVRQEIERQLAEKEEEFQCTRKLMAKSLEGMQSALETESKAKAEGLRSKKKLEADVAELDTALDHANAANAESGRTIKSIQQQTRELGQKTDREVEAKSVMQEALIAAERRANVHKNALEEARTLLEQVDRGRRQCEQELADTNETLGEQTCTNQALAGAARRAQQELSNLRTDLDSLLGEARAVDEKVQRAMTDAARLADELRAEQDAAAAVERDCKLLDAQVKGRVHLLLSFFCTFCLNSRFSIC